MFAPRPIPPPYDGHEWQKMPFAERVRLACQAWAIQGYGTPNAIYVLYILKIGLFVGMWFVFCGQSGLAALEVETWWASRLAFTKAVIWAMAFEALGFGCGSGPLTGRYMPPFGGFLYFLRPGTVKLPLFEHIPILGGQTRGLFDVLIYAAFLGTMFNALLSAEVTIAELLPTIVVLPIAGLADKTLFLVARSEHYFVAVVALAFGSEGLIANKWVWLAIWFWAATSKLNRHFPAVVAVMLSNSPISRLFGVQSKIYRNYPDDLRPARMANNAAHFGTVVEYCFPIVLIVSDGGPVTWAALALMVAFHTFITSNIPMGVPIEWNVIMVYGAFVLFGHHAGLRAWELQSGLLIAFLALFLFVIPLIGNLFPKYVSFLCSMRYYAGNWPFSIWLFREGASTKLAENMKMPSQLPTEQLRAFYDEGTIIQLLSKVVAFRFMHIHGRALRTLAHEAVDNIDDYQWYDGELVAGNVLGWNFGDGHLHDHRLLERIQAHCQFEDGDVRCIFVESQPLGRPTLSWRIADAKRGVLKSGSIRIDDIIDVQPWPDAEEPTG